MKNTEIDRDTVILVGTLFVILGVAVFGIFVQPYFEAQAYNRITGSRVSMWDAMWVEMRVDGCNSQNSIKNN